MISTSRSRRPLTVLLAAPFVVLAACGGSAADSGETVIEEKLAEDIGLGELDATCNEPDGLEEGETFTCTATTEDGATIEFEGTMTSDDTFDLVTTNLLTADDVVAVRAEGARVLSAEIGAEISPDDIACPDGVVLLDADSNFECEITDVTTGDVYPLTITAGGGEARDELFFQVGDAPL